MTARSFASSLDDAGCGSASKQAAVYLHGLGRVDRQWLLEQLEPRARAELTTLLAELEALGVSKAAGVVGPTAASKPPATTPTPTGVSKAPPTATAPLSVMNAPARDVARLLHGERDALIARILRHADAAWSRRLLACLEAGQRERLAPALRPGGEAAVAGPTQLDAAVFEALDRRLLATKRQEGRRLSASPLRFPIAGGGWLKRIVEAAR